MDTSVTEKITLTTDQAAVLLDAITCWERHINECGYPLDYLPRYAQAALELRQFIDPGQITHE